MRSVLWRSLPLPLLHALRRVNERVQRDANNLRAVPPVEGLPERERRLDLVLRFFPRTRESICHLGDDALYLNAAHFLSRPRGRVSGEVRATLVLAGAEASRRGKVLVMCLDLEPLCRDLLQQLDDPAAGDDVIDDVLDVIIAYRVESKPFGNSGEWPGKEPLAEYDATRHPAVVRFGNAELRMLHDYLLNKTRLRKALTALLPHMESERRMYAPSRAATYFTSEDAEWNLRRLITNAGFYVAGNPEEAWAALEDWAERYIAALCSSNLAWHNNFAPYYLRLARALRRRCGVAPQFVRNPTAFRIYDQIRDRNVLFLSPLAHIAQEQAESGRIRRLYKRRQVPPFSLRTVHAFVSTWPNRPHGDWSATFAHLCDSIEAARLEQPFDVFIAACGCYGLPICEHVRVTYGANVLYIGNAAHALFGIRQQGTALHADANLEMWVTGDLGRYTNVDRIDAGRYL